MKFVYNIDSRRDGPLAVEDNNESGSRTVEGQSRMRRFEEDDLCHLYSCPVWPDAKIILTYLAIYSNKNWSNSKTFLLQYDQNFAKY